MSSSTPALKPGSLILVTGVNGLVAAHIAKQLLARGYKVRGTVRSAQKSSWVVDELFKTQASKGDIEIVEVKDMAVDGGFDDSVKGVAGVVHVATITSFDPDPNNVIPGTIAGVENILKVAAKESSVKSLVFTSTVGTATFPVPNNPTHVVADSWNDIAVQMAWAPPPYTPERSLVTYIGSKVEAERALWKFVDEQKPRFRVNAVLPSTVFGPLLHEKQNTSTTGWVFSLAKGDLGPLATVKASMLCSILSWS
jgi:nucleoside-diphosphate-sugar epimerase